MNNFLTENAQSWSKIISEELHVENAQKVAWMSQYAQVHSVKEGLQANGAGVNVSAGIYATPFNTMGAGNPMMPEMPANTGADFSKANYKIGSGDIPMSTLTMALEVAAMTIGLELVPVIPATGPWGMISFMDFPYAGGKLGRVNETSFDGKGEGAENKPIYIKFDAVLTDAERATLKGYSVTDKKAVVVTSTVGSASKALNGEYLGLSRIDGNIIVKVVNCTDANTSIADIFNGAITDIKVDGTSLGTKTYAAGALRPELVTSASDHIQGFVNFFNGSDDPMSRAQNETGVGNTIGARLFSKMYPMGGYEATGTVTRQQLQDYPLYGVDVLGAVLEHMQNEISQAINNRILDRVFKLGVTNAVNQYRFQGVNLNLYLAGAGQAASKAVSNFAAAKYFVGIDDQNHAADMGTVNNATQNTSAENVVTHQRRIMSRILAAKNLISIVSRRGFADWVVTNGQVITALQDAAAYTINPMANTLSQSGEQSLAFTGSVAGLNLYCDPNMAWDDTRVCVGRKSNGKQPGVIFQPYILADTVQVTAEGTMAPKLLCNSRFAIVSAGFHPEQNYYTFMVESADGMIL